VTGLDRPTFRGHFLIARPKPTVEQIQHVSGPLARELGVVARALVAAERMLATSTHENRVLASSSAAWMRDGPHAGYADLGAGTRPASILREMAIYPY
jgi:hypothetical protein